jgi:hypothetical protein
MGLEEQQEPIHVLPAIVGVGIITYVLGTIHTLFHLGFPGIVYRIAVGGLVWGLAAFGILAAFYSDWVLGMMTGNISGLPSGDIAALYCYFVGKRFPMLSLQFNALAKNRHLILLLLLYPRSWKRIIIPTITITTTSTLPLGLIFVLILRSCIGLKIKIS